MKITVAILIANLIVLIRKGSCQSNPCPGIIEFYSDGQKNYGMITIPSPGKEVYIRVKVGIRNPNWGDASLGSIIPGDNGLDIIVNFPQSRHLPYVEKITVANKDICKGSEIQSNQNIHKYYLGFTLTTNSEGIIVLSQISYARLTPRPGNEPSLTVDSSRFSSSYVIYEGNPESSYEGNPQSSLVRATSSSLLYPERQLSGDSEIRPMGNFSWLKNLPVARTCGRTLEPVQLIIGGEKVKEGEYPWMVAMFHYKGRTLSYQCGASLISKTYVITAAHCTKNQEKVHLEFGKYDIDDLSEKHYLQRTSLKIIPHPEYNDTAHGDIALISFDPIIFSEKIKPICLWANFDNKLRGGVVAGWGLQDNDGTRNSTPMQLNVIMTGLEECRKSHVGLRNAATEKTFCAGGRSSGPCHGDSGGGFYVAHRNVWYLRGIISFSLGTSWTCNVDDYAIFADVAYFLDWMQPYLLS